MESYVHTTPTQDASSGFFVGATGAPGDDRDMPLVASAPPAPQAGASTRPLVCLT